MGNNAPGICEPANTCGNGLLESNEGCDDGDTVTGSVLVDYCSADCKLFIHTRCNTDPAGLIGGASCITGICDKNGFCTSKLEPIRVEGFDDDVLCDRGACDDAGASVTCNEDCTLTRCGDGRVNEQTEECDEAGNGRRCDYDCTAARCGDGLRDEVAGERCDDGNTSSGDGCNHRCQLETCGDGLLDRFEACDDNNTVDGDGCSADCRSETCLDGILQDWEDCEPETALFDDRHCDHDCTVPVCGDGMINTAAGEQCDDGNTIDSDQCTASCERVVCSDLGWQPLEQCDGLDDKRDGCRRGHGC